jgi:hypothetical protein
MMVRCSVPALAVGLVGTMVVVEEENGMGDVGEGGVGREARVRWHSLRRDGMEDAGRRAGSEKAWMDVKVLEA